MPDQKPITFALATSLPPNTYFPFVVVGAGTDYIISKEDLATAIGGGATFANPTAMIGLAFVNGSGTNAMRANAAQALDQNIAPTWRNQHIFKYGIYIGTNSQAWYGGDLNDGTAFVQYNDIDKGDTPVFGAILAAESVSGGSLAQVLISGDASQAGATTSFGLYKTWGTEHNIVQLNCGIDGDMTLAFIRGSTAEAYFAPDRLDSHGDQNFFFNTTRPVSNNDIAAFGNFNSRVVVIDAVGNVDIRSVDYVWPSANAAGVLTNDGAGTLSWSPSGGGGASFANPTALIGMTAVNGSGTDAMRANAAPAIDRFIQPIWGKQHTHQTTVFYGSNAETWWGGPGADYAWVAVSDMSKGDPSFLQTNLFLDKDGASTNYAQITGHVGYTPGDFRADSTTAVRTGSTTQSAIATAGTVAGVGYAYYMLSVDNTIRFLADPTLARQLTYGYIMDIAPNRVGAGMSGIAAFQNNGTTVMAVDPVGNLWPRNIEYTWPDTITPGGVLTVDGSGTLTWGAGGGGSPTFANPTALVGLTAVNGSGTNAMRANAAPALDVSINPEWSGKHIYNNGVFFGNAQLSSQWGALGPRDIFVAYGTDGGPATDRRWEMAQATNSAFVEYGDIAASVNSGVASTAWTVRTGTNTYTQGFQTGAGQSSNGYTECYMILAGQYRMILDPAGRQALSTGYRFDTVPDGHQLNSMTRVAEFRKAGVDQFVIDINGNTVVGPQSVVSTSATDGFAYMPTTNGTPTGVPTSYTGKTAFTMDSSGTKLWAYIGGGWKSIGLS